VRGPGDGNRAPLAGDAATCGPASLARAKATAGLATGQLAGLSALEPPRPMTALSFTGPGGKPVTLADRAGKTLLVNLWATWCAPCRAEMPALDALQGEFGGEGDFEVVAINLDNGSDEKPLKFFAETNIREMAFYRDSTLGVFEALKKTGLVTGLPATLLVDRDGCLIANMNGPAVWDGPDATKLIGAVAEGPAG
jgi:thiol-disulfide isomerase/thioredoxin